jgi:hypothetical protein
MKKAVMVNLPRQWAIFDKFTMKTSISGKFTMKNSTFLENLPRNKMFWTIYHFKEIFPWK